MSVMLHVASKLTIFKPTVQQLISSLMTIGTFVSSLLVGPFSSRFGRKAGLWTAALLNFIATAIMLGTTSVGALYFARLLLGKTLSCWESCRFSTDNSQESVLGTATTSERVTNIANHLFMPFRWFLSKCQANCSV